MISVKHLCKSYNGAPVLRNVSAEIGRGEIISIIGPSGTGKSTFLRCLNLLEHPDAGEILVGHTNLLDPGTDVPELRMKMGMVFQQFNLFPHMTVLENIMLAPCTLRRIPRTKAREKALELLKTVGLLDKAEALPEELSGGQQQRVAIARTLAMEPEIVLFDEPTSALDPTMVNEVLTVIRNLSKTGITMIIVTHEMRFARDVSTRVLYMDEGIVYEEGTPQEIFGSPKRPRTRAFIRRMDMLCFELDKFDFDLYHFRSEVDDFAVRQMMEQKKRNAIQLVLEELIENILFPRMEKTQLEIGISAESGEAEIRALWTGPAENPLNADDEAGQMARMILSKRCSQREFAQEDSRNILTLKLFGETK